MRTIPLIWLTVSIISYKALAQFEFTFSGYAVDFFVYQQNRELLASLLGAQRKQVLNVSRLRLRPELSLWSNAQLRLEYELSALYHSTPLLFTPQNEESKRQVVDMTWNPVNRERWNVLHFIDRLHFTQGFGFGDIVIGRQRISWGTGRIWNPTDLFNPINPTSFAKIEKDGVDGILLKFHIASFTDLSLVYNPQRGWDAHNAGARFRTNYGEFDFSAVTGLFDNRVIVGGDFAGNLFDAGVRGEGIVSAGRGEFSSTFSKFIFGVDYQFTAKLYALVEYHFNGEGVKNPSDYSRSLPKLASGELLNLGKQYLAVQASYLLHPLVTGVASWSRNLNDSSQFVAMVISYSASDEISLSLGGQAFFGDDFDEYWYYPPTFYLRGELFF